MESNILPVDIDGEYLFADIEGGFVDGRIRRKDASRIQTKTIFSYYIIVISIIISIGTSFIHSFIRSFIQVSLTTTTID